MCACMLFPDEARQLDLWNNEWGGMPRGSHPGSLHFTHSHIMLWLRPFLPKSLHLFFTHPPPFHYFPSLTVIRGDSNGKSDQVTGGHLTSLVFQSSRLSHWNPSCLWPDPRQPPPPMWQDCEGLISACRILLKDISHCNMIKHLD